MKDDLLRGYREQLARDVPRELCFDRFDALCGLAALVNDLSDALGGLRGTAAECGRDGREEGVRGGEVSDEPRAGEEVEAS